MQNIFNSRPKVVFTCSLVPAIYEAMLEKPNENSGDKKPIKTTPMLQQYLQLKARYPDCILFFRLGDFYEMFFEDAELASRLLDLTLTSRVKGEDAYPMCGVPYFSANSYIARLVEAGYRVAVCDQMEDPRQARGLVKREVTRVISPGMILEPSDLDEHAANYLAAIVEEAGRFGLAILDVTTADFRMTNLEGEESLLDELSRLAVREALLPAELYDRVAKTWSSRLTRCFFRRLESTEPPLDPTWEEEIFQAHQLAGAGCELKAARLVLWQAASCLGGNLPHVRRLLRYRVADYLVMDESTRVGLEITASLMEGKRRGSLLGVIDRAATAMGSRLLSRWLLYPLIDVAQINQRLDAVEQLVKDNVLRGELRLALEKVRDLERLLGKATAGNPGPRDLGLLRNSIAALQRPAELLEKASGPLLALVGSIDKLEDLHRELDQALVDDPPTEVDQAEAIRPGYSPRLDELREMARSAREVIAKLEAEERARTGIASLKIRYNRVFGYYFEVTRPNLHLVPPDWRRKQTTASGERFENEQLKELEQRILQAQEESSSLERTILEQLTTKVRNQAARVVESARRVAMLDALAALAEVAATEGWSRPKVDESLCLEIQGGRHPVVEKLLQKERFVPNDLKVDAEGEQILLITGPNMAGKSTVIRQAAIICLLAQAGSFVPATQARVGVVDRIFARIGAADNLARGLSTFMVEMSETANILHHATRRSLLILDEIGRGTSTFDGLSIAWAVAEYIHDRIGARTLFATHYHELTELKSTLPRVANYTMAVKEWQGRVIFLRTLERGACNRSYGIQVGRLAGLPLEVIRRAEQVLENLEKQALDEVGRPRLARTSRKPAGGQLQLFAEIPRPSPVEKALREINPDELNPRQALETLYRLKEMLDENS